MSDLSGYRNIGAAFAARVAAEPERCAVVFHRAGAPDEAEQVSYAELQRRVRVRAADLAGRFAAGDRVLIALPSGVEFVEIYLACLEANLVAVPAPSPDSSKGAVERIAAIVADCAPVLAVTTGPDHAARTAQLRAYAHGDLLVEEPGRVDPRHTPAPLAGTGPDRDSLAVLQYSSGATGTPKGVMLAHGDILDNLDAYLREMRIGPDDRFGFWLPLHHDMGLFAQLSAALLAGASAVLMPASDFLRRPLSWFRMLDDFGITFTGAPDFAYALCTRAVSDDALDGLDLSRLRVMLNGAEPINVETMARFVERFARAGLPAEAMNPGYGLAESTVYVTCKDPGRLPHVLTVDARRLTATDHPELRATDAPGGKVLVGLGPFAGSRARIVDPTTRRVLRDGEVGEIWVRGPGIGRGYWNRPELSRETFAAVLDEPDDTASGAWLRTGDLGAFLDDELFVTGRSKEMMIVRGRKLYPQDLEQQARAAHEALADFFGAAFGVTVPDERVVLVHEIDPKVTADQFPGVADAVSRRIAGALDLPMRNLVLVRRGTVSRTTSGKIRRDATRSRLLAGEIVPLYADLEPAVVAAIGVRGA